MKWILCAPRSRPLNWVKALIWLRLLSFCDIPRSRLFIARFPRKGWMLRWRCLRRWRARRLPSGNAPISRPYIAQSVRPISRKRTFNACGAGPSMVFRSRCSAWPWEAPRRRPPSWGNWWSSTLKSWLGLSLCKSFTLPRHYSMAAYQASWTCAQASCPLGRRSVA